MGVNTERFIRKPLYVQAIRVTSQNFEAVAAWCEGEIAKETEGPRTGKSYIRVRVQYPKSPRQSKAFIGDWVLYTETGYKVYTNPAFRKSFDEAPEEVKTEPQRQATAEEIKEALPHAQDRRPTAPPQDDSKTIPVREEHLADAPPSPLQSVEPGADLGTTPQGEQIEVVAATPQAIADVVNEQQPEVDSPEESTPLVQDHTPVTPVAEGVAVEESPTSPPVEDAAAGKRVLSEEEQKQMGPDAVREMVRAGDVILAQDLAA